MKFVAYNSTALSTYHIGPNLWREAKQEAEIKVIIPCYALLDVATVQMNVLFLFECPTSVKKNTIVQSFNPVGSSSTMQ